MPLTRKQAWRRVRVRQEIGEPRNDLSLPYKGAEGDFSSQNHPRQQHASEPSKFGISPPRNIVREDRGGSGSSSDSSIRSPERNVLEKWRLPKEGRRPSARPGVSAARRQAAAACVRVGSRVSFNTVVAAILIPSAKDLHAAARQELWWQETDYRDFRINFIQFMRSPPPVVDTPEMASVDIVAESSQGPPATEEKRQESERVEDGDSQPVMIDAVMYDDAQTCDPHSTESVRAWVVSPDEGRNGQSGDASNRHVAGPSRDDVGNATDEACIEGESAASLSAAAATAAVAAAATTPNEASTEITPASATENPSACVTDGGEDTATSSPGDSSKSRSAEAASLPPCDLSDHPSDDAAVKVTMGNVSGTPAAADGMGGTWEEQESNRRVAPSLSWDSSSSTGDEDDVEEGDGDDNCIRVRRSFSNLETARRRGAGLDSEIVSEASDSSEDDGSGGGHIGSRPRALSLDGWFVCGLENGVTAPSYDTHDHAERLRELVKLPPFPTVSVTPPPAAVPATTEPSEQVDFADVLNKLRATLTIRVKGDDATVKKGVGSMHSRRWSAEQQHLGRKRTSVL